MNDNRAPWYRPRNVVLVVGLVLVALALYVVVWSLTAEPRITVDYGKRMEALAARDQPPGENGWPHLVAAARVMEEVQFDLSAEGLDFEGVSPETLERIRGVLGELEARGAFDELAAAGRCPNAVHPRPSLEDGPLVFTPMPEVAYLRILSRARVASMELAIADGAHDEAVAAFDQALMVARACSHQTTLIEQLVGWSVARLALERLRIALDEHPADARTLRRYLERLDARTPLGHPALGLEGERLSFLDVVQRAYSDNGRGGGRMLPSAAAEMGMTTMGGTPPPLAGDVPKIVNVLGFVFAGRRAVTREGQAYYDEAIRRARLSYGRRHAEQADPHDAIDDLGPGYFLLKILVPAVGKLVDRGDMMKCVIGGTAVRLAIEGYRAEHGQCPPSLEALVPAWLDAVPEDPFSEGPYVYRLASGDRGAGYVLYSVGADGRDDGGLPSPVEPMAAFTKGGWGCDFVFSGPGHPAEPPRPINQPDGP
jgi:hypothetical protein